MTPRTLVEETRALVPLIREQRPEGAERARITKKVVEACGRLGLFRMAAATEVGGLQATLREMVATSEAVSAADPAVGWYLQNAMQPWRATSRLERGAREEAFRDTDHYFANATQNQGLARRVDGGHRLSGTWPVVTGVEDSGWTLMVGTLLENDEPRVVDGHPDTRQFLVPTSELEIIPTWQGVAAMRGTGSNRVRATDVFVPDRFSVDGNAPLEIDTPYTRLSNLVPSMMSIGGTVCGALAPAIDSVLASLGAQTAGFTGEARRDQAASQELAVRCRAQLRGIRAGLYEVADQMDACLARGEDVGPELRAEGYAASMFAVQAARKLASELYAGGSRDAFVRDHPVELALKDLHAIGYIMASARFIVHTAGRVMLGGEHDPGA